MSFLILNLVIDPLFGCVTATKIGKSTGFVRDA